MLDHIYPYISLVFTPSRASSEGRLLIVFHLNVSQNMSRIPTNTRSDEEALVALLIIAGLGLGSLFAIAKTIGNRLVGSTPDEDERGSGIDQGAEDLKEQPRIGNDRIGKDCSIRNRPSSLEDNNKHRGFQAIQPESQPPQLPSSQRNHVHEEGLNAIHDWETATTSRIQREKSRRLEHILLLDQRDISRKHGHEAILAWEQATMSRFRQEKARRLERLSSLDQQRAISRARG